MMKLLPLALLLLASPVSARQTGIASTYGLGDGFHGRIMSNGKRFNRNAMTLASRSLPNGTRVRITNLANGRSVVGTVTDYGPAAWTGRIADLSTAMASRLGYSGLAKVSIAVVSRPRRRKK